MQQLKRSWKKVPHQVRKPFVLIIGLLFILASAALGWLPGPGGIPLFLIGIAILATEFEWAERIKKYILVQISHAGHWMRNHRLFSAILISLGAIVAISLALIIF